MRKMKCQFLYLWYLLILITRPPCPDGMRIAGRWCSTPCTEAKETLDYVPKLVKFADFTLFRYSILGVFLFFPSGAPPPHPLPPPLPPTLLPFPPPYFCLPDTTTESSPAPPVSSPVLQTGLAVIASQCTVRLCSAISKCTPPLSPKV